MERMRNKIVFSIIALVALCVISACTADHKDGDEHQHDAETAEHGEEESIALLTGAQLKSVGIEIGAIEQKQLSGTLKANGALRVPNTDKANVNSLVGGIIKSLQVEMGDDVKKGQTIAKITNPDFIH